MLFQNKLAAAKAILADRQGRRQSVCARVMRASEGRKSL